MISLNLPVPPREEWNVLDSTKLQSYCSCPRSFFFEYVLGWRRESASNHLVFGGAWHSALEYLYRHHFQLEVLPEAYNTFLTTYRESFPESTDSWFGAKTPENAAKALVEYVSTYPQDAYELEVLDTEVGGLVPISENKSIAVKLDMVARKGNEIIVLEHKTGSTLSETWCNQWKTSLQIGAYLHTLAVCYDSPQPKVVVNGTFFYKTMRKFMRVPCSRSANMMLSWLDTVSFLMEEIDRDFVRLSQCSPLDSTLQSFYMKPTACGNFAGCQFADICTTKSNPLQWVEASLIPEGYKSYWWNPLDGVQKNLPKEEAI